MKFARIFALGFTVAVSGQTLAATDAPPGAGQAIWWVTPCSKLDKIISAGKEIEGVDAPLAELCLGAFTGIMAVNYISPPKLPFCVGDNDSAIDYVRIFLAFMRAHPEYSGKTFGLIVLTSLAQARPEAACK